MWTVLPERMGKMMRDAIKNNFNPAKIVHDPVMWKRYVEAINAQIELEIKLVKEINNEQISTMV